MVHNFQPSLPGSRALISMFGHGLSVAVGEQQCEDGSGWTAVHSAAQYGGDLTEHSHTEAGSPSSVDMTLFGINPKASGLHHHHMSNLIDKR